jgi:hypothetical protein
VKHLLLTVMASLIVISTQAAELTEQQARLKAAEWVRGPMFACAYESPPQGCQNLRSPAADKSVNEILSHIREALLAVSRRYSILRAHS